MSFIGSIFSAIISVVVSIVEAIVQVVEMVVQLIMVLLGFDGGSTQIIEYFEVRNYPLFDDVDSKNPIQQSLLQSILSDKDLSTTLIYNLVFRSLKGNVKDFMKFIENGHYFEGFPELDSYILIINHDELTAALQTLTGVACTSEISALRALTNKDWVKYWLQENKGYNVGANALGTEYREVTTSPATPTGDTVTVTPSVNHYDIDITSETVTSDDVLVDMRWQINLGTIVYDAVPDTYTIQAYNAAGVTITLPYTAPTKPTELHYVVEYYQNSTPSRIYLFIYKVGSGTYTDLDTVEEPINIDNTSLQAINSIPLRLSNANYTTFGATKAQQIEDLLAILNLDAEEMINGVLSDSGLAPGDVDHVYVTFGVRMWDSSQAGMSYLFRMFENLYPAQGSTQGTYNASPPGDDKPTNNILTNTDDNKLAFQFNYITYEFTSLEDIDADSGSVENGIYYSDMSKFNSSNILQYPYYSSSGKGTYNVGYKADNLTEVQDFLDGNGVVNPGTTSTEAADWLQVTERLSYNNPTPVLQEAGGATSTIIYLTPDGVYENNGSGVLRYVQQASEETTSGQSITYYKIKPNGLDAYTVAAPIAAMRVVDGATGRFKTVKFNLGAKNDLMVPFVYTFVKDLSHTEQGQLFLAGAHVSIYVAHYEVIHHAGMSFFQALVMIIIIIVIVYFTWGADGGTATGAFIKAFGAAAAVGVGAVVKLLLTTLLKYAFKFIVQSIIQMIIAELVDDPALRMILNLMVSVAIMSWEGNVSYGPEGADFIGPIDPSATSSFHFNAMTSFKNPLSFTPMQWGSIALNVFDGIGSLRAASLQSAADMLSSESTAWNKARAKKLREISEMEDFINKENYGMSTAAATRQTWRRRNSPGTMSAQQTIDGMLGMVEFSLSKISVVPNFNFYDALYENV
jgi:hypothetical protein